MPAPRLHVAHICSHGALNGVATYLAQLLPAMAEAGHRVTLVHEPGAWLATRAWPPGVALLPARMAGRAPPTADWRATARALSGVDVMVSHGTGANIFGVAMRGLARLPLVGVAHAPALHPAWLCMDRAVVFHPGQASRLRWLNGVSARRIVLLPQLLDPAPLEPFRGARAAARARLGVPEGALLLAMLGHVCRRKNQSAGVAVLAALGGDARLVIIGNEDRDEAARIDAAVARHGLAGRVQRLGLQAEPAALLAGADALLCTSRSEQAPMAVLEAMALGLPVFSTPVGAVPAMLADGVSGLLFRDPAALAARVAGLWRDAPAWRAMGLAGRARLEAGHTPAGVLPAFEAVLAGARG